LLKHDQQTSIFVWFIIPKNIQHFMMETPLSVPASILATGESDDSFALRRHSLCPDGPTQNLREWRTMQSVILFTFHSYADADGEMLTCRIPLSNGHYDQFY
jgi:hypothetical protein